MKGEKYKWYKPSGSRFTTANRKKTRGPKKDPEGQPRVKTLLEIREKTKTTT